uniref:Uncharacterized protein n=1 Tax=Glossina pallidipes TaxID=7398 RepID=A0A1A9ZEZ0_GLOPL
MDNCSRRCISCNIFSWALAALKSLPFSRASSSAAANSKCNLARLSCCSRIFVICSIVQPEPALISFLFKLPMVTEQNFYVFTGGDEYSRRSWIAIKHSSLSTKETNN